MKTVVLAIKMHRLFLDVAQTQRPRERKHFLVRVHYALLHPRRFLTFARPFLKHATHFAALKARDHLY